MSSLTAEHQEGFPMLIRACTIFLLSFIADRQAKLGDDRVARKMSDSVIDARFVSERSPYMRNER